MDIIARAPNLAERRESQGSLDLSASTGGALQVRSGLAEQGILLDVDLRDRRHAIETAAATICRRHDLNRDSIARALWQRELAGSTALGGGVAIPHARIAGIGQPLVLFIRPTWAIDFDAPDGKPVGMILVVLVPSAGSAEDHLRLLKSIAEKFEDPLFRAQLMEKNAGDASWRSFAAWLRELSRPSSH
jgi:PTS system nitrogen regulatory IIA component